jgi:hypothetical protein
MGAAVMAGEAAATDLAATDLAATDLAGEVEDTLLSVAVTDSVVATRLAVSPAVALVGDSAVRGNLDFLVAEITGALVTMISVDAIATFAILMGTSSISASMGLDTRTRIITHTPTPTPISIGALFATRKRIKGSQMNRITLLDGVRFISAHIGAQVYFDSQHRLIKTTLDKGIKAELMQERQADGSYKDQYLIIEDSIVEETGRRAA